MSLNQIFESMNRVIPNNHIVLLYEESYNDLNTDVIVAYIVSRIQKNEKCIYINGDLDTDLIKKKISKFIDLNQVIESNQLSFLEKEEAYSKDGEFEPRKMLNLLKELANSALSQGYTALAVTGELSWVLNYDDGFKRIMDYEYLLNEELFNSYPVSAICRYNINKFSNKFIKTIIELHPLIIWKGQLYENPFYFNLTNLKDDDVDDFIVNEMIRNLIRLSKKKNRCRDEIRINEKKYKELQLSVLENMVITLTNFLEIHDQYTKDHSQNVANYSKKIAQHLGLEDSKISEIYYAGLIHDIGKTIIPKEVLNKNDKLTEDEYDIVKKHPNYAYQILVKNKDLNHIANIVLEHHERWDGNGYPNGKKGEDISLEARIISIADAYDAMVSDRPYRKAFTKEIAIKEILDKAGKQFDPKVAVIAVEKVFSRM